MLVPNKLFVDDKTGWMYDFSRAFYSPVVVIDRFLNTIWEISNWRGNRDWHPRAIIHECEVEMIETAKRIGINHRAVEHMFRSIAARIMGIQYDSGEGALAQLLVMIEQLEFAIGAHCSTKQTHPHTTYLDACASMMYQQKLDKKEEERKALAEYADFIQNHRKTMTSSIKSCDSDVQRLLDLTQRAEKNEATLIEIGRVLYRLETRLENRK